MQLLSTPKLNEHVVQLTNDELLIINNALNEVPNGLSIPEFATRVGASESEVGSLLRQVNTIFRSSAGQ